jgi:transposase
MGARTPTGDFTLRDEALDALPIIQHVTSLLGLDELLDTHVPARDQRVRLAPARALSVVVANLALSHAPLYALAEWAGTLDPTLFGLSSSEVPLLNDDRAGRALWSLFDADRSTLLNALVLRAVTRFSVDVSELHNDSTSIVLHGAYDSAVGLTRGGKATVVPARGHSKDHRPDLKQLVFILTVTADGAVPIAHRVEHGNTEDSTTHIATWDSLCALFGTSAFLYVADSKLATGKNMDHIDTHGGRFLSVLPRTRKEDQAMRDWLVEHVADWTEALTRPGRYVGDPPNVYVTAPAPWPSAEGYRVIWCRSLAKLEHDAETRQARIAAGVAAIDELNQRLESPKTRLKDVVAIETAARAALEATSSARWVRFAIQERVEVRMRQETRGRPGAKTRYRRITRRHHHVAFSVDEDLVARDAKSDGCWPLVTNDRDLSEADLLIAYKRQPDLERRHHQLKSDQFVAPMFLRDPARIEGLMACQFIALLVRAIIELLVRRSMVRKGITDITIYPEDRPCSAPSAKRILELFKGVTRHHLIDGDGHLVQTFSPTLTAKQIQLLDLLDISTDRFQ